MQIASELLTLPKCLPDYLLCAQPALCNMGFFWISNLPLSDFLMNSTKAYLQGQVSKAWESWGFPGPSKRGLPRPGWITGTQGCLCSKGHRPLLLFVTWSKYEKVTLWMGKTKGVWSQAVWNFNASYWQKLFGRPAAEHLESLAPWDVTSSLVKEQQQGVPWEAKIHCSPFWWENVKLGGWGANYLS